MKIERKLGVVDKTEQMTGNRLVCVVSEHAIRTHLHAFAFEHSLIRG